MTKNILMFSLLVFLSCSSPLKVIKIEEYSPANSNKPPSLLYYCNSATINTGEMADVEGVLEDGPKKEVIGRFINNQLRFGLRDSGMFSKVTRLDSLELTSEHPVIMKKETVTFKLPASEAADLPNGDLLLLIDNVLVADRFRTQIGNGVIRTLGMARVVELQCTFVIMNGKNRKLLYAGKIVSETKVNGIQITIDTWYTAVNDLAGNILKKTVFKRKPY